MIQKLCKRIVLTLCVGVSVAFALDDEVKSLEKDCMAVMLLLVLILA